MDGPFVIRALQVAVAAVTVILLASLYALWRGQLKLHGRLNIAFFLLTLVAVVGFEVFIRLIDPRAFAYIKANEALNQALSIHLCFSVPAVVLMPLMLFTGLKHRRAWHLTLSALFGVAWAGTFVTGIFFLNPPSTRTVFESWQVAYLQGIKIGHVHTATVERFSGGQPVLSTTRRLEMTVKRYGADMAVEMRQGCDETPDGKVLAMSLRQKLGRDEMVQEARVEGRRLLVRSGGRETPAPWDPACLGLYAQEQSFAREEAGPGARFEVASYELAAMMPLTLRFAVKGMEDTERFVPRRGADGKPRLASEPARLLRADVSSDKIAVGGTEVQLPPKAVWLDESLQAVREQFEFPGLGIVTLYTVPKDMALAEKVRADLLPDLGLGVMIPLNKALPAGQATQKATYKVTMKEELRPPFAEDGRQKVAGVRGRTFELRVNSAPGPGGDATLPGSDCVEPSPFIDSDDPVIRSMAREAAGGEKNPSRKALKLEGYVHDKMSFSAAAGFPPASRVARDLKGDCRQHSLLLAAMLRAEGIPSRTALGLVYAPQQDGKPKLAFHMWVEAFVGGKWLPLDAIAGKGGVGATHLKMAQASWAGTETLAPLLPIAQVLGKLEVEVVEAR